MKHVICGVALMIAWRAPTLAAAQAGATPTLALRQPTAGDCSVTIEVPAGTNPADISIAVDSRNLTVRVVQPVPLVVALKDPLLPSSVVTAKKNGSEMPFDTKTVAGLPDGGVLPKSCPDQSGNTAQTFDERGVFEATGFLGSVFDNFAPNIAGGYVNSTTGVKSRFTAGMEAQYRLIGDTQSQVQLWLASYTLHGLRTADVNCTDTPDVPVCQSNPDPSTKFRYILEHATTMEAHVDARLEFLTIQKRSEVPARLYVFWRAGFLDLAAAPRVYDSDAVGVGLTASRGVFRDSYAQMGWGLSKQYESSSRFRRTKIDGVLAFDLLPGLSADGFWSKLGAGTRFFVAIAIDRNFSDGPDSVQTYVGAAFDLRRMFGSF
jgi:hypothetical protein